MFTMMLLAHILGDYVLQCNALARWKARSMWGVVVHGLLVTVVTLICAVVVTPGWWPYALFIGLIHTLVDLVRARFVETADPTLELFWLLADQVVHVSIIALTVLLSGVQAETVLMRGAAALLFPLMLLQPAWVLLRFLVRGVWGPTAAPPLGGGEKVPPMVERLVIAGLAFFGYGYLAPFVLLPRRLGRLSTSGDIITIHLLQPTHWAETLLSMIWALLVGWGLRIWLHIQ